MVLVIKIPKAKQINLIFIPKEPLFDMLARHVKRIGLARGRMNTCIVKSRNKWTAKPPYRSVVKLLIETLRNQVMYPGENRYPMPHHLFDFNKLKCRIFDGFGNIKSQPSDGDFVINADKLKGRAKLVIKEASRYERIGFLEKQKIKNLFRKIEGDYDKEVVFLVKHVYPAIRKQKLKKP